MIISIKTRYITKQAIDVREEKNQKNLPSFDDQRRPEDFIARLHKKGQIAIIRMTKNPKVETESQTRCPMFTIHRFPPFGKRFFKRIRKLVGRGTFSHMWRFVIAIASLKGRKSLSKITKLFGKRRSRQAISLFLSDADWDAEELLLENALSQLRELGWKAGDTVSLVLDDTQKEKNAKKMDAVSRIFLHAKKVYATGHVILGLAFVYRGVVIPCAVRLWAAKDYCEKSKDDNNSHEQVQFQKITDLAADAIRSIELPSQGKVIVLFDKFYLCNKVTQACESKGYTSIGASRNNRNFFPDGRPGDKRKIGEYSQKVLDKDGRWMPIAGARKEHCIAQRVGNMPKLGRVKVAFSRRRGESSHLAVVSNNLEESGKSLIEHYRNRWPIEVLFKMLKQHLGLGDYQFLRYTAVERYLHLVLISHHLLTHLALERSGAKGERKGRELLRPFSVEQMQDVLREMLFEDRVNSLTAGTKYEGVAKKLKKILVPTE